MTWRGVPLIPVDKLFVDGNAKSKTTTARPTSFCCASARKSRASSVFSSPDFPASKPRAFRPIHGYQHKALASYLISLYCSAAVLVDDAIAALEDVEVGHYHEYK